ncbi:MAG: hypothetical protein Q8R60_06735 [Mycobacteriales bacterium]|nr:hypothetical protein [Mycobacteriales bacterium]
MTGWLRTLDGEDVFTSDGEWYWFQSHQGWFHCPGLTLAPPSPPMDVRMREEARRLSTGWPSLRSALLPRKGEHISGKAWGAFAWLCRAFLVYAWGWVILLHLHEIIPAGVRFFYGFYKGGSHPGDWWTQQPDDPKIAALATACFIGSLFVTYILYMLRAWEVDEHKGNAMAAAAVAYSAYRGHQRNEHTRDRQFAQDMASELDRRHHGGYGGLR